jgi:hypothetical protein
MACLVEAIATTAIRDQLGLGGRRCDGRLVLFHLSNYLVLRRIALAVNRNRAVDGGDRDLCPSFRPLNICRGDPGALELAMSERLRPSAMSQLILRTRQAKSWTAPALPQLVQLFLYPSTYRSTFSQDAH